MSILTKAIAGMLAAGLMSAASADWASGEIRRLDPENKRMTIKHGEIKALDMPPMTMVFYVNDPALLNNLKVADKIDFQAAMEGKKYLVTAVRVK